MSWDVSGYRRQSAGGGGMCTAALGMSPIDGNESAGHVEFQAPGMEWANVIAAIFTERIAV